MKQLAIDGDILVYKCGFATEKESLGTCLKTLDSMIKNITTNAGVDEYTVFLTGKGNFREELATIQEYKANRKDKPKPKYYRQIQTRLVTQHKALLVEGKEADDALGEWLTEPSTNARCIATTDKDLNMVPGEHYNPDKMEFDYVTPEDGVRFFFTQMLTGDSTDNIPGLFKLTGKKASAKIKGGLDTLTTASDMFDYVLSVYIDAFADAKEIPSADQISAYLEEIGDLLWIRQHSIPDWRMILAESKEA